jgi:hypothetical protein
MGKQNLLGLDSWHDGGYMVARAGIPSISQKIYDVVKRNQTAYPNLEAFPAGIPDTGSGYDQGFYWTDALQALPALFILYG